MRDNKHKKIVHINEIKSPDDIKEMSVKDLSLLAVEIRDFLINHVSETGGHLASNLGTVELSLGLHYVFDSPRDKIIWDVGHQSYTHKILTGRYDGFTSLRKTDGMSGFPKTKESPHDIYETGHSSTSIAAALGMATARDLANDDYEVIAVIGDGSMTGGPAFEALNNVRQAKSKLIIILNDNEMSISQNIGGLSEHLGTLRTSGKYQSAKETVKGALDKVPVVGSGMKSLLVNTRDQLKYMLLSGGILFEEFGLTYLGPYDGHNMKDIINALNQAKNNDRPVLLHFMTKKGKGYKPAEDDPNLFHGIGPFDVETGKPKSSSGKSFSSYFGDAMVDIADENQNVTAITAAMCDATGLSEMYKKYKKRVFDVGIAEGFAAIFAAGQARIGMHPVVAIYSSFLQRAYDEIIEDICLQKLPVTLAIDRAGCVGADGETHHGIFDLSYLIPMPGMTIYAPCDGPTLVDMMKLAVSKDYPVAVRYPRGNAKDERITGAAFDGNNIRVSSGKDGDILAVGTMLGHALKAREILKHDGLDVGVVYIGTIKDGEQNNQDSDFYLCGSEAHYIFTVEDNLKAGGFGQYFAALYENNAIDYDKDDLKTIINFGWPDKFIEHGSTEDLFAKYKLDGVGIAEMIKTHINGRKA